RRGGPAFISGDEGLGGGSAGAAAGGRGGVFTLGDKPGVRYRVARGELAPPGGGRTLGERGGWPRRGVGGAGRAPPLDPGGVEDARELRRVSVSLGLMLETTAERLAERGGPHWASPDKLPAARVATIEAAAAARVPFTTGILIGIGETRHERLDALLAIRELG